MNLPNLISLARLFSVPLEVYFILTGQYQWAFWLFVIAGVSDAVDGWIAKSLHQTSWLGSYLDPLADKALLVCVYLALGYQAQIPIWLVILVVFRDLLIIGGVIMLFAVTHRVRIIPSIASKINTAMQIMFAALVLARLGAMEFLAMVIVPLGYVVAATTVISGTGYLISWFRQMAKVEDRE